VDVSRFWKKERYCREKERERERDFEKYFNFSKIILLVGVGSVP
jgi:hypothetical protein